MAQIVYEVLLLPFYTWRKHSLKLEDRETWGWRSWDLKPSYAASENGNVQRVNYEKQPGSCKDGHFRVSPLISTLRSSASLPSSSKWVLQEFAPPLPRGAQTHSGASYAVHLADKRLYTVRGSQYHNHLCSLSNSQMCLGGIICHHLQLQLRLN